MVTSVGSVHILYFLEDRAQEHFIKALVRRIAEDVDIPSSNLRDNIASARGGSRVVNEFKKFIKDYSKTRMTGIDFLVVAIDGNCQSHAKRIEQLEKLVKPNYPFKGRVVYAVPDPHIERWYLLDQRAFKHGVGVGKGPDLPTYKCEKNYYKDILGKALREGGISSLLGGVEYAERIVEKIQNLDSLFPRDASFQAFVEEIKRMLIQVTRRSPGK